MAKQAGPLLFSGTIDNLTFYIMNGQGFVRQKSCLTGKRVKKDPQFANTRRNAAWFGRGAQLASPVYHKLPQHKKGEEGVMGKMTARASALIRQGLPEEAIIKQLALEWLGVTKGALSLSRWTVEKGGGMSNEQGEISNGGLAIGNEQAISNEQKTREVKLGVRGSTNGDHPKGAPSDPETSSG